MSWCTSSRRPARTRHAGATGRSTREVGSTSRSNLELRTWNSELETVRTFEPSNLRTFEPSNLRSCRPQSGTAGNHSKQPRHRIVETVDDPFLERNDRVVSDCDVLGTDLRAALRDVAIADAAVAPKLGGTVCGIERMHLQRCRTDEHPWANELVVLVMVPEYVADVLAEKALDALPEFLDAIDVLLLHAPCAVGC